MKEVKLDYFDFFEQFKPIHNPYNFNAPENGCMFETYGIELDLVRKVSKLEPAKVWTVMTDDNGDVCISDGMHFVNRLGYLITRVEAEKDTAYYID